jgi:hypothetical protein
MSAALCAVALQGSESAHAFIFTFCTNRPQNWASFLSIVDAKSDLRPNMTEFQQESRADILRPQYTVIANKAVVAKSHFCSENQRLDVCAAR